MSNGKQLLINAQVLPPPGEFLCRILTTQGSLQQLCGGEQVAPHHSAIVGFSAGGAESRNLMRLGVHLNTCFFLYLWTATNCFKSSGNSWWWTHHVLQLTHHEQATICDELCFIVWFVTIPSLFHRLTCFSTKDKALNLLKCPESCFLLAKIQEMKILSLRIPELSLFTYKANYETGSLQSLFLWRSLSFFHSDENDGPPPPSFLLLLRVMG